MSAISSSLQGCLLCGNSLPSQQHGEGKEGVAGARALALAGCSGDTLSSVPFLLVVVGVFPGSCSSSMGEEGATQPSPLLEAVFFALIEQVCLRAPQIDNLWATVSILLLNGALFTIVGIRDSRTSTDHAAALVGSIVTLITYANQGTGTHVGIADHTFAITFFTQSSDSYTSLLAAENQIWMMFSHNSFPSPRPEA